MLIDFKFVNKLNQILVKVFDGASDLDAGSFINGGCPADLQRDFLLQRALYERLVDGEDPRASRRRRRRRRLARLTVAGFRFRRFGKNALVRGLRYDLTQCQNLLARHFAHFETAVACSRTLPTNQKNKFIIKKKKIMYLSILVSLLRIYR